MANNQKPEGGWGWAIVAGCFINLMLFEGTVRSYGFIYIALEERFHGSAVATSWIQAGFSGIALSLGPVASFLTERFHSRAVVIAGGLLISASLIISSFTPSLYFLYFSYTLIGGIGGSMIYSPIFIIVSDYFDIKRGRALGVASVGAAVGTYAIPTLVSYLIKEYGYQGCLLIEAALMLNHCVSGCLYRPLSKKNYAIQVIDPDESNMMTHDKDDSEGYNNMLTEINTHPKLESIDKPMANSQELHKPEGRTRISDGHKLRNKPHSLHQLVLETNVYYSDSVINQMKVPNISKQTNLSPDGKPVNQRSLPQESSRSVTSSIGQLFESALSLQFTPYFTNASEHREKDQVSWKKAFCEKFTVLKNPSYSLFCFQVFTLSSTILPNFVFMPPLAKEISLNDTEISILLAIVGTFGFIGTFVIGLLFDLKRIRCRKSSFYSCIAIIQGTGSICMGLSHNLVTMAIPYACIGFTITSAIGQRANVTSDYVTPEQLPFAFGLVTMFQGFGNLIGPAIQGVLKDRFASYRVCFFFGGSVLIFSSLLILANNFIRSLIAARSK